MALRPWLPCAWTERSLFWLLTLYSDTRLGQHTMICAKPPIGQNLAHLLHLGGYLPCVVPLQLQNPTDTNEVTSRIKDFHGKAKKKTLWKCHFPRVFYSIPFFYSVLYSSWLRKPGVMWLLALGEALLGFPWENYYSILVCTKFHNKEQRKAHSLATTATTIQRYLNIGSSRLLLPKYILCHRNPDGYSASLLFGREVCLWVGVFTDVIIRSYINSNKKQRHEQSLRSQ